MKMNERCFPCLINQVIKVAQICDVQDKEGLYKKVFKWLSQMDFELSNPEIMGAVFAMVKDNVYNDDPYQKIRNDYNQLFMSMEKDFEDKIYSSQNPFLEAIKYAIVGNIIDFSPMHTKSSQDILKMFETINQLTLTINHTEDLKKDILSSKSLVYLGDNCGEICLDKILIKIIKDINPALDIYFITRGKPVINDSIESDAYDVGINQYATILNNGDDSLGTILHRTSLAFQDIYEQADVVIAKGQANYESLSDEKKNIYFLFMVKCDVISEYIGVKEKSLVCKKI